MGAPPPMNPSWNQPLGQPPRNNYQQQLAILNSPTQPIRRRPSTPPPVYRTAPPPAPIPPPPPAYQSPPLLKSKGTEVTSERDPASGALTVNAVSTGNDDAIAIAVDVDPALLDAEIYDTEASLDEDMAESMAMMAMFDDPDWMTKAMTTPPPKPKKAKKKATTPAPKKKKKAGGGGGALDGGLLLVNGLVGGLLG
jgi:hypothetical protein